MIKLFQIIKKIFKNLNVNIYISEVGKYKEIYIDVVKTKNYLVCLTLNYKMQFICIEVITDNENWTILTSFDKFFKKYYCIYTFYLSLRNVILSKNREKIIDFLKNFGMSMSYDKFVNLMGV